MAAVNVEMTVVTISPTAGVANIAGNANAVAGDAVSGGGYYYFPNDGNTVIMFQAGAVGAVLTFTSVPDRIGRTGDKTLTVGAATGGISMTFPPAGFNQDDGTVHFTTSAPNSDDYFLAVKI